MALVSLGGIAWFPQPTWLNATPQFDTNGVIDANTDRIAMVCQSPVALTVDQIAVSFGACATPATAVYRLETLSGSPDQPSGSLWGVNTLASMTPAANSVVASILSANATIAARTPFALVVQSATTPISIIVNRLLSTNVQSSGEFPYGANNLTGAYALTNSILCAALHDTTLGWVQLGEGILPIASLDGQAINTGTGATTGTRRGIRFSVPVPCRLARLIARITMPLAADFSIILYDDAGGALQTMASITADTQRAASGTNGFEFQLDPYALSVNTFYRLAIVPSTANSVTLREYTVGSGMLSTTAMGANWQATAFISSAWSQIADTSTWFSLGFDQFEFGDGYLLVAN